MLALGLAAHHAFKGLAPWSIVLPIGLLAANLAPADPMRPKIAKIAEQLRRMQQISRKLMRITKYETRTYAGGEKIIDIDRAAQEDRH